MVFVFSKATEANDLASVRMRTPEQLFCRNNALVMSLTNDVMKGAQPEARDGAPRGEGESYRRSKKRKPSRKGWFSYSCVGGGEIPVV